MMAFNQIKKLSGAVVLIAASVSCGDAVRQGKAPVYLVIDKLVARSGAKPSDPASNYLQSDVLTMVTTPSPCTTDSPCPTIFSDPGTVDLRTLQKNVSATSPSTNSEVTINRYHVTYRRADGLNTPGVDVPYGYDGTVTGTTVDGKLELIFELVRHVTKMESPLSQLATNPGVITTLAEVTFYGHDQTGREVSVTGNIEVDFSDWAG